MELLLCGHCFSRCRLDVFNGILPLAKRHRVTSCSSQPSCLQVAGSFRVKASWLHGHACVWPGKDCTFCRKSQTPLGYHSQRNRRQSSRDGYNGNAGQLFSGGGATPAPPCNPSAMPDRRCNIRNRETESRSSIHPSPEGQSLCPRGYDSTESADESDYEKSS